MNGNNSKLDKVLAEYSKNIGHDKTLAIVPSVHAQLSKLGVDCAELIKAHRAAVNAGIVTESGRMSRKGKDATGCAYGGERRELADDKLTDKQDVACRFAVWHDTVRKVFKLTVNGAKYGEFDFYAPPDMIAMLLVTFPAKSVKKNKPDAPKPAETTPVTA